MSPAPTIHLTPNPEDSQTMDKIPPLAPASSTEITTEDHILALGIYRNTIGIATPNDLDDKQRPARNTGTYERVIRAERRSRFKYHVFNILLNSCIFSQILIAATIIATGAANDSPEVMTIFGGINTVIAAVVALLRGQGIPERYYQDWQQMSSVREHIEGTERKLEEGLARELTVRQEVEKVQELWDHAKAAKERNRTGTYQKQTGLQKPGNAQGRGETRD